MCDPTIIVLIQINRAGHFQNSKCDLYSKNHTEQIEIIEQTRLLTV